MLIVVIVRAVQGSIIIFSGIFSVFILKRKLHSHQWLGIAVTTSGLVTVGISSFLEDTKSSGHPFLQPSSFVSVTNLFART